ncbi:hypothetical protein GYMLUDRAFT_60348 [Collybiopsis luxurians FD-317 M1]|uniref:Uncharacterized protein n=1 Tax=Collybiopsis luxurians FD-317 M1 TaxID=944289 RepID=A0A0D0CTN9_9AGAR|nr:hypothetical protein GYMLUDRAFT_60348 [Collybiopsis luxurians FD-317 M1]
MNTPIDSGSPQEMQPAVLLCAPQLDAQSTPMFLSSPSSNLSPLLCPGSIKSQTSHLIAPAPVASCSLSFVPGLSPRGGTQRGCLLIPTVVLGPLPAHKDGVTVPSVKLGPTATQPPAPTGSKKTARRKPEPGTSPLSSWLNSLLSHPGSVPSMQVTRLWSAPAEPTTTCPVLNLSTTSAPMTSLPVLCAPHLDQALDVPTPPVAPLSSVSVTQPVPSEQPDVQPAPMLMDPILEVPEEEEGVTPMAFMPKPRRPSKTDKQKAKATTIPPPPSADGDVSDLDLHAENGSDSDAIYNRIVSNKKCLCWPVSPSDGAYSSSAEERDLRITKIQSQYHSGECHNLPAETRSPCNRQPLPAAAPHPPPGRLGTSNNCYHTLELDMLDSPSHCQRETRCHSPPPADSSSDEEPLHSNKQRHTNDHCSSPTFIPYSPHCHRCAPSEPLPPPPPCHPSHPPTLHDKSEEEEQLVSILSLHGTYNGCIPNGSFTPRPQNGFPKISGVNIVSWRKDLDEQVADCPTELLDQVIGCSGQTCLTAGGNAIMLHHFPPAPNYFIGIVEGMYYQATEAQLLLAFLRQSFANNNDIKQYIML